MTFKRAAWNEVVHTHGLGSTSSTCRDTHSCSVGFGMVLVLSTRWTHTPSVLLAALVDFIDVGVVFFQIPDCVAVTAKDWVGRCFLIKIKELL